MNTESKLTKYQVKSFFKAVNLKANGYNKIRVDIRYDDRCGNGHNTFSITGETWRKGREDMGGCIHEEIAKHFPELKHLIKWHSVSSDGPLHYIDNTMYCAREHGPQKAWVRGTISQNGITAKVLKYAKIEEAQALAYKLTGGTIEPDMSTAKIADIEAARRYAIWPEATIEQLRDPEALKARLPSLIAEFRADIEAFGFVF